MASPAGSPWSETGTATAPPRSVGWIPVAGDWTSPGKARLASAGEGPGAPAISAADLHGVLAAALSRLQQAGVRPALLGRLQAVTAVVQSLPAGTLGEAQPDRNR